MSLRRWAVLTLALGVLCSASTAAQPLPGNVRRIGCLLGETLADQSARVEALRAGLRDRGYVEGKHFAIEFRSAEGAYDRLPGLAAELVRLKVEVIVAFGSKATLAASQATSTVPIVVPVIGDPVAVGAVRSVARPGGNITGSSTLAPEISAKRLELLKEAMPHLTRVAYLLNPANASSPVVLDNVRRSVKSVHVRVVEAQAANELDRALGTMANARVEAVLVSSDTLFASNAGRIAERVAAQRLPAAGNKEFAEAGGLIGYGPSDTELYRRAAYFVERILNGARASDLPIEQAARFELVVNRRTAHRLGITIPGSILGRADKVIE